jgi:hypothetical protein
MKIRITKRGENAFATYEFANENDAMRFLDEQGHSVTGRFTSQYARLELESAMIISDLLGPFWDRDAIRYEDQPTYEALYDRI